MNTTAASAPRKSRKAWRSFWVGIAFITPNILGFLAFTTIPLVLSLAMAFTNWDLKLQNMFKPDAHIQFVGLANFVHLITQPQFMTYLGNTLYLMMGIPFSIAASLFAAMMLSKDTRAGGGRTYLWLLASAGLLVGCLMLTVVGMGETAMVILLAGLAAVILLGGVLGGPTVYRTLFYLPNFTAGVATLLLWKKLYNPQTGPVNYALSPLLDGLSAAVRPTPPLVFTILAWVLLALMLLVLFLGLKRLSTMWRDGDLGWRAALLPVAVLAVPFVVTAFWSYGRPFLVPLAIGFAAVLVLAGARVWRAGRDFAAAAAEGFGNAIMLAALLMVVEFVCLGLAPVAAHLPAMAAAGLEPPGWLVDIYWAKPALMIMGFWAAVGSNNMLLYLAALTNVPQELYEAADIDGATRFQRFWNVTWPQLAPTTFFIVVMSVIGGLQGGFDAARVMTMGGPAGSTTTLSYFIYTEGFQTGRLGYASAVAWALFILVFIITMFNWRFGNRYVND